MAYTPTALLVLESVETTSRIDPLTKTEYEAIRAALPRVLAAKAFIPVERATATDRLLTCLDALWETGCHPSVLADPKRWQLTVKEEKEGWVAQWRRPKTRAICLMPITATLAGALELYVAEGAYYSTSTILRAVKAAASLAGIPGPVTPKTLRHTVGLDLFRRHGPAVAKDSLGVSDKVLQDYTRLTAGARLAAIREGRGL